MLQILENQEGFLMEELKMKKPNRNQLVKLAKERLKVKVEEDIMSKSFYF